ncbi:hypothetical protein AMATHDRAFT_77308 [Amanita thiersii Skay4041]|uniref:Alkyl hydroperoxide reductase subunit C/ Thiol specific antioxidant domain-containing protein n=1 Tax=Amanita thiersii Skay4041 TaxID=703135 RepID=A0A2A9NHM9_9AGAR|nr:hypothetical protein AMATHDRAFT_77308 [Amanita thiersii Skay4041]
MSNPKAIPDESTLNQASELTIYNSKGEEVKFGTLFNEEKTIVIFIRHFFCGAYVHQLASVKHEALEAASSKIVVIGCGDWAAIRAYAATSTFSGPIYADPTRKLFHALGMTIETLARTPAGEKRRSYLTTNVFTNAITSIWNGPLKHPSLIGKQGNISQLGGEFILGPGNTCSFASRMQHTEDHIEIAEIMEKAGVAFP